ncbi:hypothetical protein [Candidatus Liberibacter africanus]|uniref:hypothetical protein n=1 Tax=Liberibacter TaxID=34019 RepID=UPI0006414D62|nr:hypothetical protein [Candidatus Liberibacter africanus]
MTDGIDKLTTPAPIPVATEVERPEVANTPSLKEETVHSDPQGINPFSSSPSAEEAEESKPPSEDYTLNCPDFVSEEEVKAHCEAFKEAGIDSKTAQKVIDRLVAHGEMNKTQSLERLQKALEEDTSVLKSELGAEYSERKRAIYRYFKDMNIEDADVQSLVSTWGFKKTFKFFDVYAQMNKESSVGDTFTRQEGSRGGSLSSKARDFMSEDGFLKKLLDGDLDAQKRMMDYATIKANKP